ncbi:hypothetical protein ACFV7Q_01860 [Streptomyces sp. NPDC059851]|uniref:hypothetical protein n=1 Tax=Streptomyces sp. NPDC059851 TaxID=3346971 RepID=UPI003664835A
MRIPPAPVRPFALAGAVPLLLLAAAGTAQAGSGDFQYVDQRDRIARVATPDGCQEARGGGARGVINNTPATATLYAEPGCRGSAVAVLRPGAGGQITPRFASVRFEITATAQRP